MKGWAACAWVGVGGFLGANARYLLSTAIQSLLGAGFPYGTFAINVTGSFAIGLLLTLLGDRAVPLGDEIRLAVSVGFLGAYTTFSTFEYENHSLLQDGEWLLAALYTGGSLVLGLMAVRLGVVAARSWPW